MRKAMTTTAASTALLLALTGCSGDAESDDGPESSAASAEDSAPEEGATGSAEGADSESPAESGDSGQEEAEGGHGGTSVDDPIGGTYQVGDTFEFYGTDGASSMEVTWVATEWVETEDGKDAPILVLSADNTDGDTVVDYHYPTVDGGGWHYRADDGEMWSLLERRNGNYDTTFVGTVKNFGADEGIAPGSKESGRVLWTVTEEHGGDFVYMSPMDEYLITLDIGDESVNTDNETVQQIHERAEKFDGVFIEPW